MNCRSKSVNLVLTNWQVPMQKTFTPIIWDYQSFDASQRSEIFLVDSLIEPYDEILILFKNIEAKLPEIPESILQRILDRI